MKKTVLLSFVCLLVLCLGVSAKTRVNVGIYTSDDDFSTKFWKEMFKGGGHGQEGNTLMALGQGFIFNKAVLEAAVANNDPNFPGYDYKTTYVSGQLVLNSSGPWLKSGKLKATDITATNYSSWDGSALNFTIVFSGRFDNAKDYTFEIEASYSGSPEIKFDESGNPVFWRGTDFYAEMTINYDPL